MQAQHPTLGRVCVSGAENPGLEQPARRLLLSGASNGPRSHYREGVQSSPDGRLQSHQDHFQTRAGEAEEEGMRGRGPRDLRAAVRDGEKVGGATGGAADEDHPTL